MAVDPWSESHSVTSTTATFGGTGHFMDSYTWTFSLYNGSSASGTAIATATETNTTGTSGTVSHTFTGLSPNTQYTCDYYSDGGHSQTTTVTTAAAPPKFVQLQNKAGENIYPIVPDGGKAIIEVTDTDPGEGVPLQENHFIAVYGDATRIQTNDIADGAVTSDKIDWTTMGALVYAGKVGFNKRTYSNGYMVLENKTDFYAATGVSTNITNGSLQLTFTLPPGNYIVDMQSTLWVNANSWDYMWLKNEKNGTVFSNSMGPKAGSWAFVNTRGITSLTNGDYLRTYLGTNGNNFSDGNIANSNSFMQVMVYRVG